MPRTPGACRSGCGSRCPARSRPTRSRGCSRPRTSPARATSARRRRSSCRARARPRCRRWRSPLRCRRRSSCPVGSFGSTAIEPIAFVGMSVGDLLPRRLLRGARSSPATHRRPPRRRRACTSCRLALRVDRQRRHAARPLRRLDEGLGAEAIDVERLGADGVPLRSSTFARRPSLSAAIAPWICSIAISFAGYARSAYASASGPLPSPSPRSRSRSAA